MYAIRTNQAHHADNDNCLTLCNLRRAYGKSRSLYFFAQLPAAWVREVMSIQEDLRYKIILACTIS